MFICVTVLWCAGIFKTRLESGPVAADPTTTVVHSYRYVAVKPVHSLTHSLFECMLRTCTKFSDC